MYKVKNNLTPVPMQKLFDVRNITTDLRKQTSWIVPKTRTVNFGTETIRYRGPLIWESLPSSLRDSKSLEELKTKIRLLKKIDCTCRLCKNYIASIGFLN